MLDLLKILDKKQSRPIIRKGIDCYFKDDSPKKNTAVITLSDGVDLINSGFFNENFFRQYYVDFNMKKYPERTNVRYDRTKVYADIKANTPIINVPANMGLLKDYNTYYSINPAYQHLINSSSSKQLKNKVHNLFGLLTDTITTVSSYGYTRVVLPIPLNVKTDTEANSFWEALQYAWKFGWGEEIANGMDIQLLFKFGLTNNYIMIPYKLDGKPLSTNLRTMYTGIITGGINKAIFKQVSSYDNNGLIDTNVSSATKLYICTNKYATNLITVPTGSTYVLATTPEATINEVLNRDKAQLVFDNKLMDLGSLLKANGYSLCEVKSTADGLKIIGNNAFIDSSTIAKEIPFPAITTPSDIISSVLISKVYNDISNKIMSNALSNNDAELEALDVIHDRIINLVDTAVTNASADITKLNSSELIGTISSDMIIIRSLETIKAQRITTIKAQRANEVVDAIRNRNANATVSTDGKDIGTISSVLKSIQDEELSKEIPIETSFDFMKSSISDNMDTTYAQKYMKSDIIKMVSSFSDENAEPPIFCKHIEFTDTSNELNLVNTLDVEFEIPTKKPQRLRIDIPQVSADGYLYINGTKNFVNKQIISLPIVFIRSGGQDTVAFTTNYNKVFLDRAGIKLNGGLTKLLKAITLISDQDKTFARKIQLGNAFNINSDRINTLSHNLFSKEIVSIKCKDNMICEFNRTSMDAVLKDVGFDKGTGYPGSEIEMIPFGYIKDPISKKATKLFLVSQMDKIYSVNLLEKNPKPIEINESFYRYMTTLLQNETKVDISALMTSINAGKNFMYTTIKVLNNRLPLALFVAWRTGLSGILDKYDVQYEITKDKKPTNPENDASIQFSDKFLHYKYDVPKGLLLNGISQLNPRAHSIADFEAKGDAYIDYFIDIQKSNLGRGLNNFYNEFIDPITEEILNELKIPTALDEALLYCNDMLASCVTSKKNDMSNYRLRGTESITSLVYKVISNAVRRYRDSAGLVTANVPLSVKRDTLIKELHASPVMEQMVLMNPNKEARNRIKATYKGPAGVNLSRPQGSQEVREYDKSMVGILSPTTPDSAQAGVTRYLTQNPAIIGKRGIINATDLDVEKLNAGNILATSELLSPFSPDRADSPRFGMVVSQAGHQIPTKRMDPPLAGCNAETAIKYVIGDGFCFKAKQNGVIHKIDKKNELVLIKYDDGTIAAIDMGVTTGRVGDGYFIKVQLSHNLKVGDKFTKNDVLAADTQYFNGTGNDGVLTVGALTNIIIGSADMTYEDSSIISSSLADDLSSKVTFDKAVAISHNSNIYNVKGIGEHVKVGDPMLTYEEVMDDDGDIGKLLTKLGAEFGDTINKHSKNAVPSKYTGNIIDVRIYYNRELDEYSPSIREFIQAYIDRTATKAKALKTCRRDHIVRIPTVEKINTTRIAGHEFDGLLIHYFIELDTPFVPGDKLAVGVALKSIVGGIWDDDERPYVIRNGEKVDCNLLLSPFSTASRMVPDAYSMGYLYKGLIALKSNIINLASK